MKHFIFGLLLFLFIPALQAQYQIEYWENENKRREGNIINCEKDGVWIYYYSNGKKQMQGTYQQGKRIGNWKSWYSTSQLWSDYYPETGTFTSWYPNGNIESKGYFKDYQKNGEWLFYHNNGRVSKNVLMSTIHEGLCEEFHQTSQII